MTTLLDQIDDVLETGKQPIIYTLFITNVIYFLLFFGVVKFNPKWVEYLSYIVQIFVSVFLMVRFFPLRSNYYLTKTDPKIIFICGVSLLVNALAVQIHKYLKFPNSK
jgi:hypothetical protein